MIFKKFSTFDEELSAMGFGCWGLSGGVFWTDGDDKERIETVQTAIDQGIQFFDVAPVYGFGHAETILGKGVKGKRDKILIASKCGMVWDSNKRISLNLQRESILKEVEDSLKRLDTDYIDLYQMHWPDKDTKAPIEESFQALADLREQGKIRYIGLTNFSTADATLGVERFGLSCYQGLYNLLEHNPTFYHAIPLDYRTRSEIIPFCREHGIPFLPYSPLMQGLLTSHFDPSEWAKNDVRTFNPKFQGELWVSYKALADKVKAFAEKLERPVSQVAINWLIWQKEVGPVISGGTKPEHVLENVKACDWSLSDSEFKELDSLITKDVAELESKKN